MPRAIEVDGHIINVFDSHNHVPADPQPTAPYDHRWIKIRRPLVVVGGELTLEQLFFLRPALNVFEHLGVDINRVNLSGSSHLAG